MSTNDAETLHDALAVPLTFDTSVNVPSPLFRNSWLGASNLVRYRSGRPSLSMSPTATPMP
jgi:hypothetical protein